ncbi:hypothetical protein LCB40_08130 [Lactobacillus corticis]|uniref:Metallo-beta-lactamase domain-containing protein n=1 Tax=Lactobacillus corticis TaxID=2201249 RepID=A0A916QIF5_9LACO|nr:hypothetical protein LCB40_08130 [Lactobacillus corticis]
MTNSGSFAVQRKKLWSLIVVCYLAFYLWIHFPPYGQVTLIDVGQGDSILITTPFIRKSYLIDVGGKVNFSGKKTEPQVNAITIPFLRAQGIDQLDAIFLSHQDADHVGDLAPLMKQIKVKRLYVGQGMLNNPSFVKRLSYAQNTEKIEVLAGMKVNEKIPFKIVYPFTPGSGKNEDSLSLLFNLAGKNWLFTGDLPQAGEKAIMERYNFQVDYFKLGHHGSKTSTDPDFMQKLQPKLCFISAGRQNRFGHPHPETITTLKNLAIPWVSTQDCGMISWYYGLGQTYFRSYLKGDWRWH